MPAPRPDCITLMWEPLHPTSGQIRVRDYTCDCEATSYELCQSGGLYFIRRTRRVNGVELIDECARSRLSKTLIVWGQLLLGSAR
ncbi:hypothetical protein [Nonomuraea zeae]|uniref:hypothetical protein n=1 Tax=Nonomuraea zeae TaxID=1642303 RepID=UPI00110BA0A5|nr:hypothetical protein [Nonomuraea zeae]